MKIHKSDSDENKYNQELVSKIGHIIQCNAINIFKEEQEYVKKAGHPQFAVVSFWLPPTLPC
jgi:hypothetical protein